MNHISSLYNNGGTCFLSPHSDDTSMSGLFVIKDNVLPKPYFLFTVFGDSNYVNILKRDFYPNESITAARLKEDEVFSKELDLQFLFLMEQCCKMRLGNVIFDPIYELDEVLINRLFNKVYSAIKHLNIKNLVVQNPFGDRQHFDHRIVKVIASQLSDRFGYKVFFLDDIPYSRTVLNDNNFVLYEKEIIGALLEYKHNIMNIYESQMSVGFHDFVDANNIERLFI